MCDIILLYEGAVLLSMAIQHLYYTFTYGNVWKVRQENE